MSMRPFLSDSDCGKLHRSSLAYFVLRINRIGGKIDRFLSYGGPMDILISITRMEDKFIIRLEA
jgi:hypothetical protein